MRVIFFKLFFLLGITGIVLGQTIHTCTEMPVTPLILKQAQQQIPQAASRAVSYKPQYGLYWTNGSTITVKFIDGSHFLREKVKYYANLWTEYANLNFRYVNYGQADIRVSFVENGSSWSVIGKQSLQVSQNEATMNFGWLNERTPEYEFRRTILHEFGHALGLLHEHQNPTGGIPWDEQAVYDHYWKTQGWSQQTTYQNVIQKASRNATQFSHYDPHSIMHYPVSASLTDGRYQVGMNQHLSSTDIDYIRRIYPGRKTWTEPDNSNTGGTNRPVEEVITNRPTRPKKTKYAVTISNQLGEKQISERIDLYLGEQKFTFRLDKNGKKQQAFRLPLERGDYDYKVSSASTYQFAKKVWNGWRYVYKTINRTIYGEGAGTLKVTDESTYAMYGNYDKSTNRMNVYLGKVEVDASLANVRQ